MAGKESGLSAAAAGMAEDTGMAGKKGMSGSTLKLIAIISMFLDHTGAIVLQRMLLGGWIPVREGELQGVAGTLGILYILLRLAGRLGFPIFCYLLIEGFRHTRNVKKYAGRLFLFALVSEIPFDLGFMGTAFYWGYQNVFFTLFIGLLVIAALHYVDGRQDWNIVLRLLLYVLAVGAGALLAFVLKTDYSAMGVITIASMYLFRRNRMMETGIGCAILTLSNWMEITAFFILLPVHFYNGRRGWNMKWLFYVFYPLHILLLYLIACAMGLGDIKFTVF